MNDQQQYVPEPGDIIRLPSGCGAVLDRFKNADDDIRLLVLTVENVVWLGEPQFISLDEAYAQGMVQATERDLWLDLQKAKQLHEAQYLKRLNMLNSFLPTSSCGFNPDNSDIPF